MTAVCSPVERAFCRKKKQAYHNGPTVNKQNKYLSKAGSGTYNCRWSGLQKLL